MIAFSLSPMTWQQRKELIREKSIRGFDSIRLFPLARSCACGGEKERGLPFVRRKEGDNGASFRALSSPSSLLFPRPAKFACFAAVRSFLILRSGRPVRSALELKICRDFS